MAIAWPASSSKIKAKLPVSLPRPNPDRPRGQPRASKRSRWRAFSLIAVHVAVLVHIAHWRITGSSLSPLEPSEAGQTLTLGYVNAGFVLLVLSTLTTLIVGRFFCGWACHVVAYQDASAWLLKRVGIRPRPIRSRLLAFVPLLAAIEMFALPSIARYLNDAGWPNFAWHLTSDDLWARFPGLWIAALTLFVDGFLIVYLLGAKSFCTYGCPYGAIFGIADRLAPGRIRVTDACEGCGHCTATCTSGVSVRAEVARFGMVVDSGCMKCLDCVNVCPKDALYFGFKNQSSSASKPGRPRRRYDFSWPEELFAAAIFGFSLWAWRGLYDQIPFLLALGLSVIAAVGSILLLRLVRKPDCVFQDRNLRTSGRLTVAGGFTSFGFGALLLFTTHSGLVQYHQRDAERLLQRAEATADAVERAPLVEQAEAHLLWLENYGLVQTADTQNKLGSIYLSRGDSASAASAMRRAVQLDPTFTFSWLALADLAMKRNDRGAALDALDAVLALDPVNQDVGRRLEGLLRQPGQDNQRATRMLASILNALGREQDSAALLKSLETGAR